jgi:chemotaxis protein MotB
MPDPAQCKCEEGAPKWLVTFADLMSLLLTFFVLLLSFSSVQEAKFHELAGSLKGAFGVLESQTVITVNSAPPRPNVTVVRLRQAMVQREIQALKTMADSLGASVEVEGKGNELSIKLRDQMLFPSGSGDLSATAVPILQRLATLLATTGGTVRIEGHTDDRPITNGRYPSNWELSAGRALAVLRSLQKLGIPPSRMSAVAHGEFQPLAPNDSPSNRAKNRRVELRVELDDSLGTSDFIAALNAANRS